MKTQASKEQFINALKSNWDYPESVFSQLWDLSPDLTDAMEFMEYLDGETQGDLGDWTLKDYYDDFMELQ